ncbi:MAG: family 20 glycosylhydrolase [Clostridia bacterium]
MTLETLYKFIDFMIDVKLNQLFLHVEGLKFAYASYPETWEGGTPLTGEEILLLDQYCQERCIELIPTQNCLGHMTKWLEREEFKHLAECEDGYPASWAPGGVEKPGTLAPYLKGTRELVENMTEDFLPYFSSQRYNVCLDEPYELGMGKSMQRCNEIGKDGVYLEYVLWLQELAAKHGKSLMMWGDVVKHYPDLQVHSEVTLLEWGYDPASPFEKYCAAYQEAGLRYYVCPGTACWLSLIGRIDKMRKNQENAAENGLRYGAAGYLVTSWGDRGHWEHFPIAFPGYLYGAALSWAYSQNLEIDLAHGLDLLLFEDKAGRVGQMLLRLGQLPDPLEKENASLIASIFKDAIKNTESIQQILHYDFDSLCREVDVILTELAASQMSGEECDLWKRELINNARLFCHGCQLGKLKQLLLQRKTMQAKKLAKQLAWELEELMKEYGQIWLRRNRLDGLWDSMENMRRLLREYQELTQV